MRLRYHASCVYTHTRGKDSSPENEAAPALFNNALAWGRYILYARLLHIDEGVIPAVLTILTESTLLLVERNIIEGIPLSLAGGWVTTRAYLGGLLSSL